MGNTWADWHIAIARARGRDKSGPYSAGGAIIPRAVGAGLTMRRSV